MDYQGTILRWTLTQAAESRQPLSELRRGQKGTVQWVRSVDSPFLRYLSSLGIIPGVGFEVIEFSPFDGNLTILLENDQIPQVLGPAVTGQIFIETME